MKDRFKNLKNNPEFQEKLQKMRPKRNIWGILGVIFFFFVPEVVNVIWYKEISEWTLNLVHNAPQTPISELLEWMIPKVFTGEVSYLNIAIGIGFLVWLFWDDIERFKRR